MFSDDFLELSLLLLPALDEVGHELPKFVRCLEFLTTSNKPSVMEFTSHLNGDLSVLNELSWLSWHDLVY